MFKKIPLVGGGVTDIEHHKIAENKALTFKEFRTNSQITLIETVLTALPFYFIVDG